MAFCRTFFGSHLLEPDSWVGSAAGMPIAKYRLANVVGIGSLNPAIF